MSGWVHIKVFLCRRDFSRHVTVPTSTYQRLTRSERVLVRNFGNIDPGVKKSVRITGITQLRKRA